MDRNDRSKILKRGREVYMAQLAETITDPDEIWIGVLEKLDPFYDPKETDKVPEKMERHFERRYIRASPDAGTMVVLQIGRRWWDEITAHPLDRNGKADLKALDKRRGGKLLWKRK